MIDFQAFLSKRADPSLAAGLFLSTLAVYLYTLCPSLYWGDCGELAAAAASLGIPHPTGYPLYCLLGKAWTLLLPVGSIVWRLNVLSAVFGALAVACLYGFARAVCLPRPVAVCAAGVFAFSVTFWQQCLLTETYTLAAFLTALDLFLLARWRQRGCRPDDLRLLAVAYGFTLTGHQLNTLFLPGYLACIFWTQPALLRLRDHAARAHWIQTLGAGLPALLLYAYLPLRARTHPAVNWGNPETPFAFFYHVTGRLYAPYMFTQKPEFVVGRLLEWGARLPLEYSVPLLALAAFGLCLFWRRAADRPLALLLTWVFAADLIYVINYPIYNGYIYYIPGYLVISVCAGRGLLGLWRQMEIRLEPAKRPAFAALWAVAVLLLVPVQLLAHRSVSLRGNWTCDDYGRNLLASVPPHGLLIANGDDTAVAATEYLQVVEGCRPDVTLIRRGAFSQLYDPHFSRWTGRWYLDGLRRTDPEARALFARKPLTPEQAMREAPLRLLIADAVQRGRAVCVLAPAGESGNTYDAGLILDDDGRAARMDVYLARHYSLAPIGLLTRVFPLGQRPGNATLLAETRRVWDSYALRGVYDGGLQRDPYLAPLALVYAGGDLAYARLACQQGDYVTASTSYRHVLSLFTCDEASAGLRRCAQVSARASRQTPFLNERPLL